MIIVQNILEVLLLKSILSILLASCVLAAIIGFITYLVESKEKEQSNNIVFSVLGDMLKVFCIMVFL